MIWSRAESYRSCHHGLENIRKTILYTQDGLSYCNLLLFVDQNSTLWILTFRDKRSTREIINCLPQWCSSSLFATLSSSVSLGRRCLSFWLETLCTNVRSKVRFSSKVVTLSLCSLWVRLLPPPPPFVWCRFLLSPWDDAVVLPFQIFEVHKNQIKKKSWDVTKLD